MLRNNSKQLDPFICFETKPDCDRKTPGSGGQMNARSEGTPSQFREVK